MYITVQTSWKKMKNPHIRRWPPTSSPFYCCFHICWHKGIFETYVCWKFLFISLQIHIITQTLVYKSCLFCQNGGAYNKKKPENKVLRILMPKQLFIYCHTNTSYNFTKLWGWSSDSNSSVHVKKKNYIFISYLACLVRMAVAHSGHFNYTGQVAYKNIIFFTCTSGLLSDDQPQSLVKLYEVFVWQ